MMAPETTRAFGIAWVVAAFVLSSARADAQEWRGVAPHVGTSARVLLVGTRPEDEDNALIAWLTLGRHVETAYLSLTRGEDGRNVAGTERQAPLGVVRTAELLAARQRDRARQYFTRAYDFGATPVDSVVDVSWPHDSLLRDVVSVVRAFRPHVMIALSSQTGERDATRRRAARLAAEAFTVAADTVRLPALMTSRLPPWTVSRLFTLAGTPAAGTPAAGTSVTVVDVGEFSRGAGRSYAEIGADIRRLQRSQGVPAVPSVGPLQRHLQLDSSRTGDAPSLFGTLDTTWRRFHGAVPAEAEAQLDTLQAELGHVQAGAQGAADSLAVHLARVARRASAVRLALPCRDESGVPLCRGAMGDLAVSLNTIRERAIRGMLGAAGVVIDGTVARHVVAAGDSVAVAVTVYNGGSMPVVLRRVAAFAGTALSTFAGDDRIMVLPDSTAQWSGHVRVLAPSYHWWQINGLVDGTSLHVFRTRSDNPVLARLIVGEDRIAESGVEATVVIGGEEVPVIVTPLVFRTATSPRGDVRLPLAGVPEISILLDRFAEYVRAAVPIDRLFRVHVSSARSVADTVAVTLRLPPGLRADSITRTVALPPFGARNVFFRLRGTLQPGSDTIAAVGRSVASRTVMGAIIRTAPAGDHVLGVVTREYPHIPARQFVRFARNRLEAVDVRIPPRLHVAYVRGTEDLRTPLVQLRVSHQPVDAVLLPAIDLSGFTTVLIGTDALTGDALAAATPALQRFLRNGGTVVALASREGVSEGLLPYPVTFDGVVRRVKDPEAPVRVTDPRAPLLRWPNVITTKDFERWNGDRAYDVPIAFDPRYHPLLSMGDAGEEPTAATLLVARVGRGTMIYTSLTLGTQLDEATPGAARLMINLMAAGLNVAPSR